MSKLAEESREWTTEVTLTVGIDIARELKGFGYAVNIFVFEVCHSQTDRVKSETKSEYLFDSIPGVHFEKFIELLSPITDAKVGQEMELQDGDYYRHKINTEFTQKVI